MNEEIVGQIIEIIRQKRGMDFSEYRTPTILRRLRQRMRVMGCSSLEEYFAYLLSHMEEEIDILVDYFLINTTEFFRDPLYFYYFEYLAKKMANLGSTFIKVLSIGCASGEEPYSCAMILNEIKTKHPHLDFQIDAIDVDAEAIEEARGGIYFDYSIKNIPSYYLSKYFVITHSKYKIVTSYFDKNISFYHKDIFTTHLSFGGLFKYNFVFVRNILLYFRESRQRELFTKIMLTLEQGGYLVLGSSEHIVGRYERLFEQACKGIKIFRFKGWEEI